MKKFILSICMLTAAIGLGAQTAAPAIPTDENIERKIEDILSRMSLDEKIGQMCEITIDVLQKQDNPFFEIDPANLTVEELRPILEKYGLENEVNLSAGMPTREELAQLYTAIMAAEQEKGFQLDEERLDLVIGKYKVGSILNVPAGIAQSTERWQQIIKRIQEKSLEVMGIPCVYGVDQIHGTTYTAGGTLFPQGVNMGATFNRALVRREGQISAYETKAGSIPWVYAPVTDLGRDPRWPRMWENYGEDCYLNAEMGRETVLGFQGDDPNHIGDENVAACMKHFMGYGMPRSGKDRTPSSITDIELREKHFAPYLEMIRNGALSIMINSGNNNGIPFHANHELLTGWLKEELNWDGMIVTDWADIDNLWKRDHVAADKKEAIKLAINAGIDMSMDPYDLHFCDLLKELVEEGEVPMSRIDDAVRRVLRLKFRLNLFEKPYYDLNDYPLFGSEEHAAAALQAAKESLVLLKNEGGILPLAPGTKILLTGPNSNSMRCLDGGWSYTWQGSNAEAYSEPYNTILEAFTAEFGSENVIYEPGVTYDEKGPWWAENEPEIGKAVAAATDADIIVACIGENSYCETAGNLNDLYLSRNQLDLVKALAATGKPIVLILSEGRPRIIAEIEPLASAVVDIMLPGNYGGDALAQLLAGKDNFSGKMPFTYPKDINSLINYDYKPCENTDEVMEGAYDYSATASALWGFGYGLSYTSYQYSNLRADKTEFKADDELTFTVDVTNKGDVAGKESVLLFSSDLVASVSPDNRRLRAFEKVELAPGQTASVELKIKASDLAFVGPDGKWILEAGDFLIRTGSEKRKITCTETRKWDAPNK